MINSNRTRSDFFPTKIAPGLISERDRKYFLFKYYLFIYLFTYLFTLFT